MILYGLVLTAELPKGKTYYIGFVLDETTNSLLMQIADLLQFCNPSHIIEIQCHILCYALKFYYDLQVRELINILVATSLEHINEDGAVVPLNPRLKLFLIGVIDNLDKGAFMTLPLAYRSSPPKV